MVVCYIRELRCSLRPLRPFCKTALLDDIVVTELVLHPAQRRDPDLRYCCPGHQCQSEDARLVPPTRQSVVAEAIPTAFHASPGSAARKAEPARQPPMQKEESRAGSRKEPFVSGSAAGEVGGGVGSHDGVALEAEAV